MSSDNDKLVRIKHRVNTEDDWNKDNPILANGEIGVVRCQMASSPDNVGYAYTVVGDGVTKFTDLFKNYSCRYNNNIITFTRDIASNKLIASSYAKDDNKFEVELDLRNMTFEQASMLHSCSNILNICEIYCSIDAIDKSGDTRNGFGTVKHISVSSNTATILVVIIPDDIHGVPDEDSLRALLDQPSSVSLYSYDSDILAVGNDLLPVVDNTDTEFKKYPLSARQGKVLNDKITQLETKLETNIGPLVINCEFSGLELGYPVPGTSSIDFSQEYAYIQINVPGYAPMFMTKDYTFINLYSLTDANQTIGNYGAFVIDGTEMLYVQSAGNSTTAFPLLHDGNKYIVTFIMHK